MSREPHIPLFLWIATAIVAHAIWGGGAHQVSKALEETLDIGAFAREVQRHVRLHSVPVEVSLLDEQDAPSLEVPSQVDPAQESTEEADPQESTEVDPEEERVEEKKKREEEKKKEKEPERPQAPEPEPDPEPTPEQDQPQLVVPPEALNRVAVEQHVEDKDQEDNPDAAHIAEHANRVEQETRARITSTDQNEPEPSPGERHAGSDPEPGNSEESRVAQSDDAEGDPDRPPGDTAGERPLPPVASQPAPREASAQAPGTNAPAPAPAPAPTPPSVAQSQQDESPEVHELGSGRWSLARPLEGRDAQKAVPPRRPQKPTDLLGLGATGTTRNGVNLNLSPQMAVAAVGADQLARERRLDGERRKSAHRGSWQSLGLERWKPALENYVASVQVGNQTALNTARVPFARYLNAIHLRIHPVFADRFLASLQSLPKDHPLNREDMSTHLEIVLSKEDGRIVRMGITKSSGVTAFDVGALDSVQKASPFGAPPDVIVSPDGNVYLHWEFHRLPHYACSTYFARPYILKSAPETAPPRQGPPRMPPPRGEQPYDPSRAAPASPGQRSGFLHRDRREASQPRG